VIRLSVTIKTWASIEQNLLEALRYLKVGTQLEPGCLRCSVWSEPDSTIQYVEEWETEAALTRHVRSTRFTSLLGVLESAPEQPQVRFDFINQTRGLEYVAELRQDLLEQPLKP
jgi:quinol monooxygenase YgiN